jgi:hypothetical protein
MSAEQTLTDEQIEEALIWAFRDKPKEKKK